MANLLVTELRADGSPITPQSLPIPNPTVATAALVDGVLVPTSVPVTSAGTGGVLSPGFSVSAEFNAQTAFLLISGGPALINFGNDPRPSRNGIPIPADGSSITLPVLGRKLAVL
jgi:hypothetical protein